jgi:hypothetical protein
MLASIVNFVNSFLHLQVYSSNRFSHIIMVERIRRIDKQPFFEPGLHMRFDKNDCC